MAELRNIFPPVLTGMVIVFAGTIPRNLIFAANLRYFTAMPWALPLVALYIWFFWRYLNGYGPPASTAAERRNHLRANKVKPRIWLWSIMAGILGIITLVIALRIVNRLIVLPQQQLPDLTNIPPVTVWSLLLMAAPVAGIIEEAAFRGYMQGPITKDFGLPVAILVTGTMFAVAHLDFTPVLWPYYLAVAAIYGTITHLARSILPAIVLHTAGNLYSNMDLLLHGHAEWQAAKGTSLVWDAGADTSFWLSVILLLLFTGLTLATFFRLADVSKRYC